MSIKALNWAHSVCANTSLDPADKAILTWLAYHHHDKWGTCAPSQKTLGNLTSYGERHVRNILNKLEVLGLIKREKRSRKDGRGRSSDNYALFGQIDIEGMRRFERSRTNQTNRNPSSGGLPELKPGGYRNPSSGDKEEGATRPKKSGKALPKPTHDFDGKGGIQ